MQDLPRLKSSSCHQRPISGPLFRVALLCTALGLPAGAAAMGLRSLVALPVDKGGTVLRFTLESTDEADRDSLVVNAAHGIDAGQTLLAGLPYRIDPGGPDRTGDLSLLYRYIAWRRDLPGATDRLGLLLGALLPSQKEDDAATQAGLVFTRFKGRNEFDADLVYAFGYDDRPDSARYDLSWQYRLLPAKRPLWGLPPELNSVIELGGRWRDDEDIVHQLTLGLQWIHPRIVIDGGIVRDIENGSDTALLLSARIHF